MASEPIPQCDAQAIIDTVRTLSDIRPIDLADGKAYAVPRGFEIHSIKPFVDEQMPFPERVRGVATLDTLDSFIDHIKRFSGNGASVAVFATAPRLLAVYDYHSKANPDDVSGNANWCQHRAVYAFPISPEWKAWRTVNGGLMSQAAFAEMIEDRIQDIAAPKPDDDARFAELGFALASPAQLLALSRGLRVRVDSEAVSKHNLSTGEIEVAYKEEHTDMAGASLKIPGGFILQIPLHLGGPVWRIPVRLRYRVQGGKVSWQCNLYRTESALADALKEACEKVQTITGAPLFYGEPESED